MGTSWKPCTNNPRSRIALGADLGTADSVPAAAQFAIGPPHVGQFCRGPLHHAIELMHKARKFRKRKRAFAPVRVFGVSKRVTSVLAPEDPAQCLVMHPPIVVFRWPPKRTFNQSSDLPRRE